MDAFQAKVVVTKLARAVNIPQLALRSICLSFSMQRGDYLNCTLFWLISLHKGHVFVFITENFAGIGFEPFVEDATVDTSEVRRIFEVFCGIGHEFGSLTKEATFDL